MEYSIEVSGSGGGMGIGWMLFCLAVAVIVIVGLWRVFAKAGKPGWAAIVPIYNLVVLLEIVGKPLWWIVLFIIPIVNFVAGILVNVELAKCFGRSIFFALGLIFIPVIFFPILGFGSSKYLGAAGASASQQPQPPPPTA